jgi:hypothetical protein
MMILLAFVEIDGLSSWRDFPAVFTFSPEYVFSLPTVQCVNLWQIFLAHGILNIEFP